MRIVRIILYVLAALVVFFSSIVITMTILIKDTESVNCPDAVGKDLQEARRIVERNGLALVVVRYEKRSDIPYNEVIAQRPEANMSVRRGRTVSVVVSEGPLPVSIPDLLNHPLEMAQTILQEKGIKLKSVVYVPDSKEGRVIGQSPRTGSQILDEAGMVLFVGQKAKSYYVMPEIMGVDYTGLVEELDKRQIEYRLTFTQKPDLPAKAILDTSIPSRSVFSSDQVVRITVNLGDK